MESDLDQESGECSLRRGHLRKDLKEARGQMGEGFRQRGQQVESPSKRAPAFRGPASTHSSVVGAEVWEDIKNGDETGRHRGRCPRAL